MGEQASKPLRIVTRLILFLLLGAIVNVAVAWGISAVALKLNPEETTFRKTGETYFDGEWSKYELIDYEEVTRFSGFGSVAYDFSSGRLPTILLDTANDSNGAWDRLPRWCEPTRDLHQLPPNGVGFELEGALARGWPLVSMICRYDRTVRIDTQKSSFPGLQVRLGIDLSRVGIVTNPPTYLPLRPIWPGFAINTIFYAAILWTMFVVLSVLRRKRRRLRGLCIHCGYDLRGAPPDSANCPECGKPIERWTRSAGS